MPTSVSGVLSNNLGELSRKTLIFMVFVLICINNHTGKDILFNNLMKIRRNFNIVG